MDFSSFIRFLTDFSVFPDVVTKSDAYRIFMNLAFSQETVPGGHGNESMAFKVTQHFGQDSSKLLSSIQGGGGSVFGATKRPSLAPPTHLLHVLDIHLFVESLAFCAMHLDTRNTFLILDPQTQASFEKLLMLIEKMSVSEGLRRMKRGGEGGEYIKSMGKVEKVDIMAPFRGRYKWYFEARDKQAQVNR
jgi:hypothetical protein